MVPTAHRFGHDRDHDCSVRVSCLRRKLRMMVGVPLGILMAMLSGILVILLIRTAARGQPELKTVSAIGVELFGIPTFWFGGPWLTTGLIKEVALAEILTPYVISLAVVFTLIASYPLFRFIAAASASIKQSGSSS